MHVGCIENEHIAGYSRHRSGTTKHIRADLMAPGGLFQTFLCRHLLPPSASSAPIGYLQSSSSLSSLSSPNRPHRSLPPTMLTDLPPEIIGLISYHIVLDTGAPPAALLATSHHIHAAASPTPELYARVFRDHYDSSAAVRRLGPLKSRDFGAELRTRTAAFARLNAGEVQARDLWVVYVMLLENGEFWARLCRTIPNDLTAQYSCRLHVTCRWKEHTTLDKTARARSWHGHGRADQLVPRAHTRKQGHIPARTCRGRAGHVDCMAARRPL